MSLFDNVKVNSKPGRKASDLSDRAWSKDLAGRFLSECGCTDGEGNRVSIVNAIKAIEMGMDSGAIPFSGVKARGKGRKIDRETILNLATENGGDPTMIKAVRDLPVTTTENKAKSPKIAKSSADRYASIFASLKNKINA